MKMKSFIFCDFAVKPNKGEKTSIYVKIKKWSEKHNNTINVSKMNYK